MKGKLIIFLIVLIALSAGCTSQPEQIPTINTNSVEITPPTETVSNEVIIKEYITDFLTKGYSKYYGINSIESKIIKQDYENNRIEAFVYTNMSTCNPVKNPDTVPYILAAKEKAYKETDLDKKRMLQQEYLTLYSEYIKPFENNFAFKCTAELKDEGIDKASIQLFIEIDGNQGVKYEPAEGILPKK